MQAKRHAMVAAHNATVGQLTEELDSQLMIARERREKCERDVANAQKEWEETQRQMEEDLDGETEVGCCPFTLRI